MKPNKLKDYEPNKFDDIDFKPMEDFKYSLKDIDMIDKQWEEVLKDFEVTSFDDIEVKPINVDFEPMEDIELKPFKRGVKR